MRMKIKVLCICMLMSFFFTSVGASIVPKNIDHQLMSMNRGTIYVDDDGDDGYCHTIQEAINRSKSYDTIIVYSGNYYGPINIQEKHYITIQGYNVDHVNGTDTGYPKVNGCLNGSVFLLEKCMDFKIIGMNISNSFNHDTASGIKLLDCGNCEISNNLISNNNYGLFLDSCTDNCLIEKNIIDSNSKEGILLMMCNRIIIRSNHIHDSGLDGINLVNSKLCTITMNNISLNKKNGIKVTTYPLSSFQIGRNKITQNNIEDNGEVCENMISLLNTWDENWWGEKYLLGYKFIFVHDDMDFICFPWVFDHRTEDQAIDIPEPFIP